MADRAIDRRAAPYGHFEREGHAGSAIGEIEGTPQKSKCSQTLTKILDGIREKRRRDALADADSAAKKDSLPGREGQSPIRLMPGDLMEDEIAALLLAA